MGQGSGLLLTVGRPPLCKPEVAGRSGAELRTNLTLLFAVPMVTLDAQVPKRGKSGHSP